jgi:hypothetical protein
MAWQFSACNIAQSWSWNERVLLEKIFNTTAHNGLICYTFTLFLPTKM